MENSHVLGGICQRKQAANLSDPPPPSLSEAKNVTIQIVPLITETPPFPCCIKKTTSSKTDVTVLLSLNGPRSSRRLAGRLRSGAVMNTRMKFVT